MSSDDTTKLATIRRKESECRTRKAEYEDKKEQAKDAKTRWEAAVDDLCGYIQDSDQQELDLGGTG